MQTASDGPAAVDTAEAWQPDLLVLDVMLPGLRRPGGLPPGPGPAPRAGADADRAGRRDGHAGRPRGRRRRLHDQAVLHARARRPGARPAAPGRARDAGRAHARAAEYCGWGAGDRPRPAPGAGARRGCASDPDRVRPAGLPGQLARARSSPASSCWPRCGTGRTPRAPARSTATSRPCAARSAPSASGLSTAWATRWRPRLPAAPPSR